MEMTVAVAALEPCMPRRTSSAAAAKRMAETRARTLPITGWASTMGHPVPRGYARRFSRFTNLLCSLWKNNSTCPMGPFRCLAMMISAMFFFSVSAL